MSDPRSHSIDIRLLFDALLHRWRIILVCMCVMPIGAAAGSTKVKPKYVSSAKVLVQENNTVNPFLSDMMVEWTIKKRLPVITNVMKSRQTAERVLFELGYIDADTSPEEIDKQIDDLQRRLSVFGLGGGVIQIKYQGKTPDEAYKGMTVLMDIFTEEMLAPQKEALDQSVTFLEAQVVRVRGELKDYEDRMRTFKEENSEELPEVYKANLDAYLKMLQAKLSTQSELAAQRQQLRVSKERLTRYDPVAQEVEAQLVQARSKLAKLRATYKDGHPAIRAASAHLSELETRRKSLVRSKRATRTKKMDSGAKITELESLAGSRIALPVDTGVSRDETGNGDLLLGEILNYRLAEGEVGALEQRLRLIESQAADSMDKVKKFAKNEQVLNELERDITIKTGVYKSLLKRYEDALVTRELTLQDEASRVWLIDKPRVPSNKSPLPAPLAAIIGLIGGLVLGCGLSIGLEFLDSTVRSADEAAALAGVPVLGRLPPLPGS